MSSSLQWWPAVHPGIETLSDKLKYALRKRHHEPVNVNLDSGDLPYLAGLRDAGIEDAQELIDAIEKHYEIRVKEEY